MSDEGAPTARDLATQVSWNYDVKKQTKPFKPRPPDVEDGTWRMPQPHAERVQAFWKCIECFLCQDVYHVLRDRRLHHEFIGPRFFVCSAALVINPLDTEDLGARGEYAWNFLNDHQNERLAVDDPRSRCMRPAGRTKGRCSRPFWKSSAGGRGINPCFS